MTDARWSKETRRPCDTTGPGEVAALAAPGGTALDHDEEELKALSVPFDSNFRVPFEAAKQDPFFQASYFGVAGQPSEHELAWRQIETDG